MSSTYQLIRKLMVQCSARPQILLISRRSLRLFTITGHPRITLLSNLSNGVAVDYDWRSRSAYFSQVSPVGSYIGRASLDVNDEHETVDFKVCVVADLAL